MVAPAGLDLAALRTIPAIDAATEPQHGVYSFETPDPPTALAGITSWARDNLVPIRELRVGRESLEDIFLRLTGDRIRE
jgi:ABC-2 type transport system ATP-binding protein